MEFGPGQFRVRNIFLSVDPAQRGWACDGTNYAPGRAPWHGHAGTDRWRRDRKPLRDRAGRPAPVRLVRVAGLCRGRTRGDPDPIEAVAAPLSAYAGVMGINGLTAWLALMTIGRPRSGETVLVTTCQPGRWAAWSGRSPGPTVAMSWA